MDSNLLNDRIGRLKKWEQTESLNEILFGALSSLSSYSQSRFDALMGEIRAEAKPHNEPPVIKTAVCLDGEIEKQMFLFPVSDAPPLKSPGYVTTVFADCGYPLIQEILAGTYAAQVHGETGTVKTRVTLRYSDKYLQKLQSLYLIFADNELPWATVNSAYFYKFLDVYSDDIAQDAAVGGFDIDFGQYGRHLSYDKALLWNVCPLTVSAASCQAVPAFDAIAYEHVISGLSHDENSYLICPFGERFTSFMRGQEMHVRTYSKQHAGFDLLRVSKEPGANGPLYLPPKSNQRRAGFIQSLSRGRYVPTRGEAERIVQSLGAEAGLSLADVKALPFSHGMLESHKGLDYNYFIETNKFLRDRDFLLFTFKNGLDRKWAHEAMYYILSELQLYFFEYRCIGEMA